jgi:hypothetical protein
VQQAAAGCEKQKEIVTIGNERRWRSHSVAHAPEQLLPRERGWQSMLLEKWREMAAGRHLLLHGAHEHIVALQTALRLACNAHAISASGPSRSRAALAGQEVERYDNIA